MKVYSYSFLYRVLYKFGNIPLTFLLILFITPIIIDVNKKLILLLPVVVSLLMLYFLNKSYLQFYKILCYKIVIDGDLVTCSNFLFSKKVIEFKFSEITSLDGGIFSGRLYGVMKIKTESNHTVGFFNTITGAKELETLILSKVKRSIYDIVLNRVYSIQKPGTKEEQK